MSMRCHYAGEREHVVIEYVYNELERGARAVFEAHLAECDVCREEVTELRGVRAQLGMWSPPSAEVVVNAPARLGGRRWWQDAPAWMHAAAAVLCLGVAAGAANLTIQYGQDGLTIRTGWSRAPLGESGTPRRAVPTEVGVAAGAAAGQAPWHADLASLERQLRSDFQLSAAPGPSRAVAGQSLALASDDILKRARALVAESERNQQRELALRVAEVFRDVQAQRQADLVKIDRSLSLLQNNTGVEVMRQRQLINSLAVRVSQRQ